MPNTNNNNNNIDETMQFRMEREVQDSPEDILMTVYHALRMKGYDPINQIVGYIISGDPTYITSHGNARYLICRYERDELLEEIVRYYIVNKERY